MGFRIAMFESAISARHGRVIFGTDRCGEKVHSNYRVLTTLNTIARMS
jgi:hypothetical protein